MCPVVTRQTVMLASRWITSAIELLALILARSKPWHIAWCATMPMARINVDNHVVQSSKKQMRWKACLLTGSIALWVVEQEARSPVGIHVAVRVWRPIGVMVCLMA